MDINSKILDKLRNEYGEAFYLLDSKQFRNNFIELKGAFSELYPNFNIAYSYKTNYTPKLCKIVNELGGYAEVVSEMEMELAVRCGVPYDKIIWNGPIKNHEKLEEFLLKGGLSNIDNLNEAKFIQQLAIVNPSQTINVGIRCNFDVGDGVISRFGTDIDSEDFNQIVKIIKETENLHFVNFQCHFAKRQIEYWPARVKGMLELVDKIDLLPERIDIGGGLFGKMPESLKNQFSSNIPEYKDYAKVAAGEFAKYYKDREMKPELVIEPGSALVGDCMKFLGTVKDIKQVRGKTFATILGSQKNISMTGVNPPMEVVAMGETSEQYSDVDFVGFTCIEGDVLYRGYNGQLAIGDAVVISNCGSYSLVMKPPFILPNFPVIDISEGDIELIKKEENFEDVFHTFTI